MSSCRYPGGCATTAIRLAYHETADPFQFGRLQLLGEWLATQPDLQDQQKALERAWGKLVEQLEGSPRRWSMVKGTISAVIATLMDLEWEPRSPTMWVDSDGEEFHIPTCDHDRLLKYALSGAVNQQVWQAASKWHLGRGAERGVDLTTVRRHLARLRRREDHGRAAVLQMVATGSLWPAARRFGAEGAAPTQAQGPDRGPFGSTPSRPVSSPDGATARAAADMDEPEAEYDLEDELQQSHLFQEVEPPWEEPPPEQPAHFSDRPEACNSSESPRCQEGEETTFHQLWECPCNADIPGVRLEYLARARAEWREAPCFWLLGLTTF
jgi:hypothetical protein